MNRLVIDASVAVKWFLPDAGDETETAEALDLLFQLGAGELGFLQPAHWKTEIAGVLARRVPHTVADSLDDLMLLEGIELIDTPGVYWRAIELAQTLNQHLFDTLYHATALETDSIFLTADWR